MCCWLSILENELFECLPTVPRNARLVLELPGRLLDSVLIYALLSRVQVTTSYRSKSKQRSSNSGWHWPRATRPPALALILDYYVLGPSIILNFIFVWISSMPSEPLLTYLMPAYATASYAALLILPPDKFPATLLGSSTFGAVWAAYK